MDNLKNDISINGKRWAGRIPTWTWILVVALFAGNIASLVYFAKAETDRYAGTEAP